ncbi:GNAT family N-acetyltransferase [uncultured Cohaesibacter sp.]|uniref:GNAT family N-acetyltransferase n=1 Tax=uncultured Cohaesibacter sp. TaxID=1002546 RepID=UPI0029C86EA6|nr:GNAT family N-acetyltransferase [uncultured Cohaesibacter sp.]
MTHTSTPQVTIRSARETDSDEILRIYQEGIDTGNATFTAAAPTWEGWDTGHLAQCRLVAEADGKLLGWAALSAVSSRCVYQGVAEVSVYVSTSALGQGIGSKLMSALITDSEENGIWTLQSAIFPENEASINAHQKHGFRVVGNRQRLAKMTYGSKAGTWRDVVLLERRSAITGTD